MANIKFELFCNRKKFNIINWLKAKEDKSYESFVSFLESKSVLSPGEEYFNKAVSLVQSMEQRQQEFQEKKVEEPKVEKKETIPIDVEIVLPTLQEELEEKTIVEEQKEKPKPKTRRRRRKKDQDES
jgi:outer membrane biosynthesis protein TonB